MERAVEKLLSDRALSVAMYVLLDELREWIEVRGITKEADERAGDYVAEWQSTLTERGPIKTVLDALKEHPDLWLRTLPKEAVIVSRETLQRVLDSLPPTLFGSIKIDVLESQGRMFIDRVAHAARIEREEREAREDAERPTP